MDIFYNLFLDFKYKKKIDSEYDRIAISVTWMYLNVVLLPEEFDSGKSNKSPKYDKLVGNSIYIYFVRLILLW